MKNNLKYKRIDIIKDNLFEKTIDLKKLENITNDMFIVNTEIMDLLNKVKDFPIKSREKSIHKILTLLKEIDGRKLYSDGIVSITYQRLQDIFSPNTYSQFMRILADLKIVRAVKYRDDKYYRVPTKERGGKTKQYQTYHSDNLTLIIFHADKKVIDIPPKTFNLKLTRTVKKTQIDLVEAINDEVANMKSENSLRARIGHILSIYSRRYVKYGKKTNRVFHSLTNISKISRKHFYCLDTKKNKLRFNNIDIANCQPLLLAFYLKKNNVKLSSNDYIQDCERGEFYEKFLLKGKEYKYLHHTYRGQEIVKSEKKTLVINWNTEEEYQKLRGEIKVLLYKSIFFSFKVCDVSDMFNTLYPEVYEELKNIKKTGVKMAAILQNIEASIFNDLIPKKSHFYFTLFDAIYFTDEKDIRSLEIALIMKFRDYDLNVKLKINE